MSAHETRSFVGLDVSGVRTMAHLISRRSGHRPLQAWRLAMLAMLAGLMTLSSGCVSTVLARRIAAAPNRQDAAHPLEGNLAMLLNATYANTWQIPVEPPAAELAVAVIDPGYYHMRYEFNVQGDGQARLFWRSPKRPAADGRSDRERPQPATNGPAGAPPKGTVVLLHGIQVNRETTLHWALRLAEAGYRAVLVDLRGHGASTGDWVTFGALERADLVQVLDSLEARGLGAGRVGVLGVSYGAVVGLHWAARDPRVKTVVALAPFCDARQAITEFSRSTGGRFVSRLSDRTFASATARVARLGGFTWEEVDVLAAMRKLNNPVLLIHGDQDTWVSPTHSQRLMEVAPTGSRLIHMPEDDHPTLMARLDPLAEEVIGWFDAQLHLSVADHTHSHEFGPPAGSSRPTEPCRSRVLTRRHF